MQYVVALPVGVAPDVTRIARAIDAEDASAVVDLTPSGETMRISTTLSAIELGPILRSSGLVLSDGAIVQRPSECCGGCGG